MSPTAEQRAGDQPRFDSLQQQAFLNLWRTYDRLRAFEEELFSKMDLTPQQYNVLRLLKAAAPAAVPTLTLATRLVSRAPDITRMLDKLERRGLIHRERPKENRRTVRIGITPAGLRLVDEVKQPLRDCHAEQLGHLKPAQLRQLIELLHAARAPHEDEGSVWR